MARARFLALGDSYTIGEGVAEHDRWPGQLARALAGRGLEVDVELIAQSGWTADELEAAITRRSPIGPFDFVTLLIGVNNQYRGMMATEFQPQFRSLFERAIALAGGRSGRVVTIGIPDWGVTPFNTQRDRAHVTHEIDAYNGLICSEAAARGARFVDIVDLSRADPGAVVADGLHPTASMYARWVARIVPVAAEVLSG